MPQHSGTPVWFELTTPDQDKAQAFYEAVMGWTVAPSPMAEHGGYRLAGPNAETGVAGIMAQQGGMPTGWTIYLASDDVDAMASQISGLGGKVLAGPMDIPHIGRFAAVTDPQGVRFNIMKGSSPQESQAFKQSEPGSDATVGHGVWIELATPDPDGAIDFYHQLFGWEAKGAMPMPVLSDAAGGVEGGDMGDYTFVGTGEDFRPGAVMSSATTGAPARWNWYVHVPDIDAAVATAKEQGGELKQGPDPIPGGAFSANVKDAQGFQIGLVGARQQGE